MVLDDRQRLRGGRLQLGIGTVLAFLLEHFDRLLMAFERYVGDLRLVEIRPL